MRIDEEVRDELAKLVQRFGATGAFIVMLYPVGDDEESTEAATVGLMHPDADGFATVAMLQRELADFALGLVVQEQGNTITKVEVDRRLH